MTPQQAARTLDDAAIVLARLRVLVGRIHELAANHQPMPADEVAGQARLLTGEGA